MSKSATGWEDRSLASLATYLNGFAFKPQHWGRHGLPIIRIRELLDPSVEPDRYDGPLARNLTIHNGDLIFSWSATLAALFWDRGPAYLNQHLFKVSPASDVDARFLNHLINFHLDQLAARSHGTTMKHVTRGDLAEYMVELPKSAEQEHIANVLDALDDQIRRTAQIMDKLNRAKQGIVRALLTEGIDTTGARRNIGARPSEFVNTALGVLPKEWQILSVGDICSLVVDCPHSTPTFLDSGVLVARTTNIKGGAFIESGASYVSEAEYRERISRAEPREGDIVLTREAPVGEAFIVPSGMRICLGQRVMLLRTRTGVVDPRYLLTQLYSGQVRERIDLLTAGTTNPHLNVAEVKKFGLPIPSFAEQERISDAVGSYDCRISREAAHLRKLSAVKDGLRTDLLTGRVRVPLEAVA